MERQDIQFEFLGQKVGLKSSGDPNQVDEAVRLATTKLEEVRSRNKKAAPHQIALIALLELAEQYVDAKVKVSAFQKEIQEKTERIHRLIQSEIE